MEGVSDTLPAGVTGLLGVTGMEGVNDTLPAGVTGLLDPLAPGGGDCPALLSAPGTV
jgi:hypothetical protein